MGSAPSVRPANLRPLGAVRQGCLRRHNTLTSPVSSSRLATLSQTSAYLDYHG